MNKHLRTATSRNVAVFISRSPFPPLSWGGEVGLGEVRGGEAIRWRSEREWELAAAWEDLERVDSGVCNKGLIIVVSYVAQRFPNWGPQRIWMYTILRKTPKKFKSLILIQHGFLFPRSQVCRLHHAFLSTLGIICSFFSQPGQMCISPRYLFLNFKKPSMFDIILPTFLRKHQTPDKTYKFINYHIILFSTYTEFPI